MINNKCFYHIPKYISCLAICFFFIGWVKKNIIRIKLNLFSYKIKIYKKEKPDKLNT